MLFALLIACSASLEDRGCLDRNLAEWCYHDESADGPVNPDDLSCDEPSFEANTDSIMCGDVDITVVSAGGFTGMEQYFDHASGELIAVRYSTDTNHYCGGFNYWYGERVLDCTPECSYDPASTDLPVCGGS